MRIAVLGAGGLGAYYGGTLARAGHDVRLLARGENLAALRSHGLEVREPEGTFTVAVAASDRPEDLAPADLVLVTVKSYSLSDVAAAARRLSAEGGTVLPLLNGVEAFESLVSAGVPEDRILGGLTIISVERTAPGIVERRSPFRSVVVGERDGSESPRALRAARAFREAGAEARVSGEIAVDLWRKFLFIATVAAGCGLARSPIGAVRAAPLGALLLERAVREIGTVGRARGVRLPPGEEERVLDQIAALPGGLKPSFLLDLERGGPNELEVLSGAVVRFGRAAGVPTPIHDTAVGALGAAR